MESPSDLIAPSFLSHLLTGSELPNGFMYPKDFLLVVRLGLIGPYPWKISLGESLSYRNEGIKMRYPERRLVPFADCLGCDDVACFDPSTPDVVRVINDFSKHGEQLREFSSFKEWYINAVHEMFDYWNHE